MIKQGLNLERVYQPDEEAMLNSLALLLRSKDPPEESFQETKETTNHELARKRLMVSQRDRKEHRRRIQ